MEPETQSLPRQFFEELKRRRVIRVATLYVLALWPIIQIVDILSPALGLPPITMRYLLLLFVGGLPVALILSWLYDLNKGGIVRSRSDDRPGHPLVTRSAEITVISVLILAIAVLFFLQTSVGFEDEVPSPAVAVSEPAPGFTSIAVLPFVSFSESPEDEQFSDGLTEELLNVLSQLQELRVIARTTSFAYKGVNRNVQDIGAELGVDTILEGSVRRNDVDNRIRVTAQLIETASGAHLWSETFDREFRDIFRIQDEIAAAVVQQLNVTLMEGESRRLQARATANPEAMIAFGMGRTALGRRTSQSLRDAERYFKDALAADAGYAEAHAGLANAYSLLADLQPAEREQLLGKAQVEIDKALALDPNNGAVWAASGLRHLVQSNTDPAAREPARDALARAIELNPNLAMAHMWYGNLQEDPTEQHRYHAIAFELDPRSPVAGYNLANDLLQAGREAEAMEIFSKIVEADPNYPGAYQLIGQLNEYRGRLGEAIRNYERVYKLQPSSATAARLARLWVDIGDFEAARRWTRRAQADLPPEMENTLLWLRISAAVAEGGRADAETIMTRLIDEDSQDSVELLNAAHAGYFLGRDEEARRAWERLETIRPAMQNEDFDGTLLEAKAGMAFVYQRLGDADRARRLIEALRADLNAAHAGDGRVHPGIWYTQALLYAIEGNNQRALIELQRAVDEGWRQHWRPAVEPAMAELVTEPAFDAMMRGLTTRMDLIREQIAFDASFEGDWQG